MSYGQQSQSFQNQTALVYASMEVDLVPFLQHGCLALMEVAFVRALKQGTRYCLEPPLGSARDVLPGGHRVPWRPSRAPPAGEVNSSEHRGHTASYI